MPRGIIKYYSDNLGYGFIESEEKEQLLVRYSEIKDRRFKGLKEGEAVKFSIRKSLAGLEAVNVHRA
jgi:CspA family cold shock protein